MRDPKDILEGFGTAESRWARFGPYYAMFPLDFAFDVIQKYSNIGDHVLDPFAGRCSSVFAGGVLGRPTLGIEISPVGWLYGKVKLNPSSLELVLERLDYIYSIRNHYKRSAEKLPKFYHVCFCKDVLCFLLAARRRLNWKIDGVDATLMSVLLVYLHGKIGESLSNQMPITKAMGMNYSIEWWGRKGFGPPEVNPLEYIASRLRWRYAKGTPQIANSSVIFGDSTVKLKEVGKEAEHSEQRFSLLFTSPPYFGVTDYHADQWLRLWLLGGAEKPKKLSDRYKGRFSEPKKYYNLLNAVFQSSAALMSEKSTIYVRTDAREYSFKTTLKVLEDNFPQHKIRFFYRPFKTRTQTEIFGNKTKNTGEIDIILTRDSFR